MFLIGDAPPNPRNEVDKRRNQYNKWAGTKFATPVYWDTEVEKLKKKGIPVHCFYVDDWAKESF